MLVESLPPEHSLDSDERETLPPLFENDHADVKGPDLNIFSDNSNSPSYFDPGHYFDLNSVIDSAKRCDINFAPAPSTCKSRFIGGVTHRFQLETVKNQISKEQDEMITDKKTVRSVKKEITSKSPKNFRLDSEPQSQTRYNLRSKNKNNSYKEQQEIKVRSVLGALANKISTFFQIPEDYLLKSEEERVEILKTSLENYRAGK